MKKNRRTVCVGMLVDLILRSYQIKLTRTLPTPNFWASSFFKSHDNKPLTNNHWVFQLEMTMETDCGHLGDHPSPASTALAPSPGSSMKRTLSPTWTPMLSPLAAKKASTPSPCATTGGRAGSLEVARWDPTGWGYLQYLSNLTLKTHNGRCRGFLR